MQGVERAGYAHCIRIWILRVCTTNAMFVYAKHTDSVLALGIYNVAYTVDTAMNIIVVNSWNLE